MDVSHCLITEFCITTHRTPVTTCPFSALKRLLSAAPKNSKVASMMTTLDKVWCYRRKIVE